MNVDLFLDPLADPEPIEELLTTVPDEQMKRRAFVRRWLEVQRERKELDANLYDVLSEEKEAERSGRRKVH